MACILHLFHLDYVDSMDKEGEHTFDGNTSFEEESYDSFDDINQQLSVCLKHV